VRHARIAPSLRAAILLAVSTFPLAISCNLFATSGNDLALYYLIQKVCLDQSDRVLSVDPYYCPVGDMLRSPEPGEALPYHRYDQPVPSLPKSMQGRDSYPVRTSDGQEFVIDTFDHAPFRQFKPALDCYDITMVRHGWASIGGTRSGGGEVGTTFFGAGCKPYNGWILFPVSALNGQLIAPGRRWFRSGASTGSATVSRGRGRAPLDI
jgi:hypothetical protein